MVDIATVNVTLGAPATNTAVTVPGIQGTPGVFQSILGTTNEVNVAISGPGGSVATLSTPQAIATTSSPTFAGMTLNLGSTNLSVIDTSGYTPTSSHPFGLVLRNTNIYTNLVTYGSGGILIDRSGAPDSDQPVVFTAINVSTTSDGNTAVGEDCNVAGGFSVPGSASVTNTNYNPAVAIGVCREMIALNSHVGTCSTVTITNGGSGYVSGTYTAVPVTAVSSLGINATATIVVTGGVVTSVTMTGHISSSQGGSGANYVVGDTLTASNANLGGSGSGLVLTVASVVGYNGKLKINVVSGVTGSSSIYADGYTEFNPRRAALSPSGANTGFDQGPRFTPMSSMGQGWITSPGSGLQCTPIYNYGVPSQVSLVNSFQSSNFTNTAQTASGMSATVENGSFGPSGSSYIRTKTSTGGATLYCETDDTSSVSAVIVRSNWGGTAGTGKSELVLYTDSSPSGWALATAGNGTASVNTALNLNGVVAGVSTTYLSVAPVTGVVTVRSTTASTSTTTGALVVDGGVGVAGAVFAGSTGTFGGQVNINASGAGLIQTTTGDVTAGGPVYHRFNDVNGNAGYVGFGGTSNVLTLNNQKSTGLIILATNNATRLTIDQNGAHTISTPTSGTGLTVNGGGIAVTGASTFSSTINSQTISSAANFTGTMAIAGVLTLSALTANSFLYSGTSGALTTTSAPTNGQLLIGSAGAAPVAATLTQGATNGVTVTNGAGSITLDTAQDIRTSASPTFVGATFSGAVSGITTLTTSGVPTFQTLTAATSGANRSSPALTLGGTYWTGAVSANDTWNVTVNYATGSNPKSTINFNHATGSSGGGNFAINGNFTVSTTGAMGTIGGVATVGNGVAVLQSQVNITTQTANVAATTVLGATTKAGMYRVSSRIVVSQAATTSSTMPDTRITYTDLDSGATITEQLTAGSTVNTTSTFAHGSTIISAAAASNIQYDIGQTTAYASSGATAMQFSYRLRLEYLG